MLDPKILDELADKLSDVLPSSFTDVQKDCQQQFRLILDNAIAKLDLVTREEFDAQRKVLARTREKVAQLEQQLAAYEKAQHGNGNHSDSSQ